MSPTVQPDVAIDDHLDAAHERRLADDVLDGLTRPFKEMPPKHFYDARGCELFDRICELPEYYPTRAERAILQAQAEEIVAATGAAELVELGSGTAAKTRVLLDAMAAAGPLRRYVPFDVAESVVRASAEALVEEYPGLRVHGVVGDFERHLDRIPPPTRGRAARRRAARRDDRQLPARQPPAPAARDRRAARPRRPPAARHRPRQGPGRARGRLRRRGRRDGGVQPQRPARAQPRARRRLPLDGLRARRLLRPPQRVDRDAAARAPGVHGARSRRSACTSSSPRARRSAPRSARSSRASACARTSPPRACGWPAGTPTPRSASRCRSPRRPPTDPAAAVRGGGRHAANLRPSRALQSPWALIMRGWRTSSRTASGRGLRRPARLLRLASDERLVALVRAGDEARLRGALRPPPPRDPRLLPAHARHARGGRGRRPAHFLAAFRDLVGEREADRAAAVAVRDRAQPLPLAAARAARARRDRAGRAGDRRARRDRRAPRGPARAARRPRAPARGPARALLLAELGALDHAGIATRARLPAGEGEGARVPGTHVACRQPRGARDAVRRDPRWSSRRRAARRCGAARCAGTCAHATAAARSRPRSRPSASCSRWRCRSCPSVALKASVLSGGGASRERRRAPRRAPRRAGRRRRRARDGAASTGCRKVAVSLAIAGVVGERRRAIERPVALTARRAVPDASLPRRRAHPPPGGAPQAGDPVPGPPRARRAPLDHSASRAPDAGRGGAVARHSPDARTHRAGPPGAGGTGPERAAARARADPPPRAHARAARRRAARPSGHGAGGRPRRRRAKRARLAGQAKTPPGQAKTPPGHGGIPPGQANTSPARPKTPPGHGGTPPGQATPRPARPKHTARPRRRPHRGQSRAPAAAGPGAATPPDVSARRRRRRAGQPRQRRTAGERRRGRRRSSGHASHGQLRRRSRPFRGRARLDAG